MKITVNIPPHLDLTISDLKVGDWAVNTSTDEVFVVISTPASSLVHESGNVVVCWAFGDCAGVRNYTGTHDMNQKVQRIRPVKMEFDAIR